MYHHRELTPSVHILQRLKRIASTLQLDLSELLTETLRPAKSGGSSAQGPSRDAILALLRTYSSLNAIPIAEDIIREAVVRPRLAALINRDNFGKQAASDETAAQSSGSGANTTDASQVESPRSAVVGVSGDERHTPSFYSFEPIENKDGTDSPLAKLYNDILAFVSSECGLLLDVGERSLAAVQPVTSVNSSGVLKESAELATKPSARPNGQNNKQGYHILANVVWHEIATKLMNELGQIIFAAGRPSIFHEVRLGRLMCGSAKACTDALNRLIRSELRAHDGVCPTIRRMVSDNGSLAIPALSRYLCDVHQTLPAARVLSAQVQGDRNVC